MRILIANDGWNDAGGVQTYLDAVAAAFELRGHQVAVAYCTDRSGTDAVGSARSPRFRMSGRAGCDGLRAAAAWRPDACYSHNMSDLDVERSLLALAPTIKFMHGYFGTCVSGLKMHAFPRATACERTYGAGCLAWYLPRRCGCLSPAALVEDWRWAEAQRALFARYAAIVVASEHMRAEYVKGGVGAGRVTVNALFPARAPVAAASPAPLAPHVAFLGRMTAAKGGDLLIRAIHRASQRLGTSIVLSMIGEGPQRGEWEALARRLGVAGTFTGWVSGDARWPLIRDASLVALPSVWPEPFGLVGLEAGALGVPAIAFDSGGIAEWLRDGTNGRLVRTASAGAFADALASLLADRARLAALRTGALRVAREMSLARHVNRLEEILHAACGAGGPAVDLPCASC